MAYRELRQRRILITGASSGIGDALAVQLGQRGARLLLTARRDDRLRARVETLRATGVTADYVAGDLAVETTRRDLRTAVDSILGGLDILINNAGVGAVGAFAEAESDQLRRIMEVNFFAPAELTRKLLPVLRQGSQPLVVNVGSVLGHVAVPNKSEYCASKFALRGWNNALRMELEREGLQVLLVDPNTTRSEFFDQMMRNDGSAAVNPWSMTSERVAGQIVRAIERGRCERILTFSGHAMVWLDFLGGRWFRAALRRWG